MVGSGIGCHFRVQSALVEYRENLVTQCVCMQALLPTPQDYSGTVPFKEGTLPCLQPQGGFLKKQEGFLPSKNSEITDLKAILGMLAAAPKNGYVSTSLRMDVSSDRQHQSRIYTYQIKCSKVDL